MRITPRRSHFITLRQMSLGLPKPIISPFWRQKIPLERFCIFSVRGFQTPSLYCRDTETLQSHDLLNSGASLTYFYGISALLNNYLSTRSMTFVSVISQQISLKPFRIFPSFCFEYFICYIGCIKMLYDQCFQCRWTEPRN